MYRVLFAIGNILAVRAAQPPYTGDVLLLGGAMLPRHSFALIYFFGLPGLDFIIHLDHLLKNAL